MIVAWFKAKVEYPIDIIFFRLNLEDPIACSAFSIYEAVISRVDFQKLILVLRDSDVADGQAGLSACTRAAVVPEPVSVSAPVGDNECHAPLEIV